MFYPAQYTPEPFQNALFRSLTPSLPERTLCLLSLKTRPAGQVSSALLPDRKVLQMQVEHPPFPKSQLGSDPALHTNARRSHPISSVTWSLNHPTLSLCPSPEWTCPRCLKFYVELLPPLEQGWFSADFPFRTSGKTEAGSKKPVKGNWMNILFLPIVTPSFPLITLIETNLSHLSPITSHKGKWYVIPLKLGCCWTHLRSLFWDASLHCVRLGEVGNAITRLFKSLEWNPAVNRQKPARKRAVALWNYGVWLNQTLIRTSVKEQG